MTKETYNPGRNLYIALMIVMGIFSIGLIPLVYWLTKKTIENAIIDARRFE